MVLYKEENSAQMIGFLLKLTSVSIRANSAQNSSHRGLGGSQIRISRERRGKETRVQRWFDQHEEQDEASM